MDLDLVRIRLYIEKTLERPGLFYGKNRVRVCDDIWVDTVYSWRKHAENHTSTWKQVYKNDKASSADGFYALDINKFAVLS